MIRTKRLYWLISFNNKEHFVRLLRIIVNGYLFLLKQLLEFSKKISEGIFMLSGQGKIEAIAPPRCRRPLKDLCPCFFDWPGEISFRFFFKRFINIERSKHYVGLGIDWNSIQPDLIVQMRAIASSGAADRRNDFSP